MRLVLANPEELGQGEIGERGITGPVDDLAFADLRGEFGGFVGRALVAPDEGGRKNVACGVEKHGAMHLPGEADGGDFRWRGGRLFQQLANGLAGGAPPVVGILFGPAGFWRSKRLGAQRCARQSLRRHCRSARPWYRLYLRQFQEVLKA